DKLVTGVQTCALPICESVRLFVDRAKSVNSLVVLSDENATALGDICRSLDGLPLAIELAAMRTRVLTPEQISTRLEDGIDLLGRSEEHTSELQSLAYL